MPGTRPVGEVHELGAPGQVVVADGFGVAVGKDHDLDVGRDPGEVFQESMSTCHPVREQCHVQRAARVRPRPVDPADLEDDDPLRAELDRPFHRDVVDNGTIEVPDALDLHDREHRGDRRRRQDRLGQGPCGEPVLSRFVHVGGDTLEFDRQILESFGGQDLVQQRPQSRRWSRSNPPAAPVGPWRAAARSGADPGRRDPSRCPASVRRWPAMVRPRGPRR